MPHGKFQVLDDVVQCLHQCLRLKISICDDELVGECNCTILYYYNYDMIKIKNERPVASVK